MMNNKELLLNRKTNELLYEFEAREYDKRHPETLLGDRLWWEDFGKKYIGETGRELRVLDIGTGTGLVPLSLSRYLNGRFCFICYDIAENMLAEARDRLGRRKGYFFIRGDALELPFGGESFDVVIFNSLLHHLLDYRDFLAECKRILKKKGIIAFAHEPNRRFLDSRTCRILSTLYNITFPIDLTRELQDKVNAELKRKKLISKDLSKEEIRRLVEYHSPMEQSRLKIDCTKGFVPEDLLKDEFQGYKVLEFSEYSTYFHRPFFEKVRFASSIMKLLGKIVFKRGNLFRMILQK